MHPLNAEPLCNPFNGIGRGVSASSSAAARRSASPPLAHAPSAGLAKLGASAATDSGQSAADAANVDIDASCCEPSAAGVMRAGGSGSALVRASCPASGSTGRVFHPTHDGDALAARALEDGALER